MRIACHLPKPPLQEWIECLWLAEDVAAEHRWERVLPNGSMQLLVDLGGEPLRLRRSPQTTDEECFSGAVWSGAYAHSFAIAADRRTPLLGIAFKPGGAAAFLDLPADELHEEHVQLEALWKAETGEFLDRLHDSTDPGARFQCVEEFLGARLRCARPRHAAVAFALAEFQRQSPPPRIDSLVRRAGWSHRRFVEVFRQTVGLTPKQYSRVARLQNALARISVSSQIAWADLAFTCGFTDQAHLIHEFRTMTGLTPVEYAAQRSTHANHVPLPDPR